MFSELLYSVLLFTLAIAGVVYYFYRVDSQKKKSSEQESPTEAADLLMSEEESEEEPENFPQPQQRSMSSGACNLGLNHRGLILYKGPGGSGGDPTSVTIQGEDEGTTPYGDVVAFIMQRSDGSSIVGFFSVESTNPYVVEFIDILIRLNGNPAALTFLAQSGINLTLRDPDDGIVPYVSTTQVSGMTGTINLDWVNLIINALSGEILNQNYINGDNVEIEVVDTNDDLVDATFGAGKIVINDLPAMTVDFEADDLTPNVGDTVAFTDESTHTPDSWCWRFGVNQNSFVQNPSYVPVLAGHKDVRLMAAETASIGGRELKTDYLAVGGIVDKYPTNNILSTGVNLQVLAYENTAIMTVRRNDSTTQDFLAINGILSKTELETFSGGQRCTVSNWKQQDGTGREWVQATVGSQPEIVDSSGDCRVAQNGYPAPYFDGTDDFMTMTYFDYFGAGITALYGCFAVQNENVAASSTQVIAGHFDFGTNSRVWRIGNGSGGYFGSFSSNGTTPQNATYTDTSVNGQIQISSFQIDTTQTGANRMKVWKNLTQLTSGSPSADISGNLFNPSTTQLSLGCMLNSGAASGFFTGYIQMASIWTGVQANRADIEACTNAALNPLA